MIKLIRLSAVFLCLLLSIVSHAQDSETDSLKRVLIGSASDTNRVNTLNAIATQYYYADQADSALRYSLMSRNLGIELDYLKGMAVAHSLLANIDFYRGNYVGALQNNLAALKIKEELQDNKGIANSYNNIGNVYLQLGNLTEALKNHLEALRIRKEIKDTVNLGFSYNNLGNVYQKLGKNEEAITCHLACLEVKRSRNDWEGIATSYSNLGNVYLETGNHEEALLYLFRSLAIHDSIDNKEGVEIAYVNISNVYLRLKDYVNAEKYALLALNLATEIGDVETVLTANYGLNEVCRKTGRYEEALTYFSNYVSLRDSLYNEEGVKEVTQIQLQYEFEKTLEKNEAAAKAEKEQNRIIILVVTGVLILAIIMVLIIYRNYQRQQKANLIISDQKSEVERQKKIIETKNIDITSSIEYAKRIQQAILPSIAEVKAKFPESFVLYKPKDIVAGDFYWVSDAVTKYQEKFVMAAVVDCTGHGVPGALISIIGNNFLRLCEVEPSVNRPSEALDFINVGISRTLRQEFSGNEIKDGMDMVFVAIDYHSMMLHFAGAKNSIYIVRNKVLTEFKGDRHPIGSFEGEALKKFTNHSIPVEKGDCVYLFSDGYADQFGGPEGKKFMYNRFKQLLVQNSDLPMEEQHALLDKGFHDWIGELEQVDDVCVFGIRV